MFIEEINQTRLIQIHYITRKAAKELRSMIRAEELELRRFQEGREVSPEERRAIATAVMYEKGY